MALRDQPYLPLYIQDFLTDEKLAECSAESTGVYIRLMCLFHKSDTYGKILLKQKYKQSDKQILNFASQVAKNLPYDLLVVQKSLNELFVEGVIQIEGDYLYQKRMVKDGQISDKRALAGGKGGKKTQDKTKVFASTFAKAKSKANTEYVIEDEYKNENKKEGMQGEGFLIPQMWEKWKSANRIYPADKKKDFPALKNIAEFICGQEHIQWMPTDATETGQILTIWDSLALFIVEDSFFSKYSLEQVFRHIQSISQSFQKNKPKTTKQKIDEADAAVNEYLNR